MIELQDWRNPDNGDVVVVRTSGAPHQDERCAGTSNPLLLSWSRWHREQW